MNICDKAAEILIKHMTNEEFLSFAEGFDNGDHYNEFWQCVEEKAICLMKEKLEKERNR